MRRTPSQLITGILIFLSIRKCLCQKSDCQILTENIYFDDENLKKVKSVLESGGSCSPGIWKNEIDNVLRSQGKTMKDLSRHDQIVMTYLSGFRNPHSTDDFQHSPDFYFYLGTLAKYEAPPPLFESETQRTPTLETTTPSEFLLDWRISNDVSELRNRDNGSKRKRQTNQRLELFRPSFEPRRSRIKYRLVDDNNDKNTRKIIPQTGFNYDDQNQFSNFQEMPIFNNQPENYYFESSGPSQDQNRPAFQFKANNQKNVFTSNNNENTGNNFPGNLVGNSQEATYELSRPNDQGNSFLNNGGNQKRQPFPRRPFLSSGQRRPFNGPDLIMPDDERLIGNDREKNDVFFNQDRFTTRKPQTPSWSWPRLDVLSTSSPRPDMTTRPGPPTWATPPSLCVRRCPNTPEYNPVCGTDKVTYRNPGLLRCEKGCGKDKVGINHFGTCGTTTESPRTSSSSFRENNSF